jgi:hypothetical protein
MTNEAQHVFSCHVKCNAGLTKEGQGDVSGIPDIGLQYSVTLCGASLAAGYAAADVFTPFSLSRTPWARGCIDWRAPFCRLNQFLAGVEAVSLKTRSTCCVRLSVLLRQQTDILDDLLFHHAKSFFFFTENQHNDSPSYLFLSTSVGITRHIHKYGTVCLQHCYLPNCRMDLLKITIFF